ncbi:MAG: hypothetical protein A2X99_09980 [Deltaproteobacteria bacterium GWB2_55_19]|nr:MAG: hypothetical protein A2X99_09980 [Deltaproteobacteria bacterium GWB2_55_19]HAO94305.1 coproporphyrinogen III oxidase [Deltaproteobacteria bacterium]
MGVQGEERTIGVYLHVPFCLRKCPYCDFKSVARPGLSEAEGEAYADALIKELSSVIEREGLSNRPLETVYFGGGTPTLLAPSVIKRLIGSVRGAFAGCGTKGPEITIEANPDTVSFERLKGFREAGATRISIGVQSFDESILGTLGRTHTARRAVEAFKEAREAGFDNIGLDLIFGVPGQSIRDWEESVAGVLALQPEHISLYGLTIEEGTEFFRAYKDTKRLPDEDDVAQMYESAVRTLKDAGYRHYEISNWARPGYESVHNSRYWRVKDYIGCGVGAHSFLSFPEWGRRWWNTPSLEEYIEGVSAKGSAVKGMETLTREEAVLESMVLGLRMLEEGIKGEGFRARFGLYPKEAFPATEALLSDGLMASSGEDLILTHRGAVLSDAVFLKMLSQMA